MLTVQQLVDHLKTRTTRVAVKRLYDYVNGSTHEMGVTIRIKPLNAKQPEYRVFHLHYNTKHKGEDPEIKAHFKAGHKKTDSQSFDLSKHDAYGIYVELLLLYPPTTTKPLYSLNVRSKENSDIENAKNVRDEPWVPWCVDRITKARIKGLIDNHRARLLKTLYVSKIYDLSFWDQDAWILMLESVT